MPQKKVDIFIRVEFRSDDHRHIQLERLTQKLLDYQL
jgi:hypothetical protein